MQHTLKPGDVIIDKWDGLRKTIRTVLQGCVVVDYIDRNNRPQSQVIRNCNILTLDAIQDNQLERVQQYLLEF